MKYISDEGLVRLKQYQYKSSVYTPLDNAMQPYWNGFVKLFPMVSDLYPNESNFSGWLQT